MTMQLVLSFANNVIQMMYVVNVLEPLRDTVGFAFGQLYRPRDRLQAIVSCSQVVRVPRYKKDAFGRFHMLDDIGHIWKDAVLHRQPARQ